MKDATLIIYTDGGAVPNPGPSGSGIHMVIAYEDVKPVSILGKYNITNLGYILKTNMKTEPLINQELKLINPFPSDADYNKTIKQLKIGPILDICYSNPKSTTNNQAELDAVIFALKNIDKIINIDYNITNITILSDSTYVLGILKKILLNILDLKEVNANVEYVSELKDILLTLNKDYKITIGKVKAHDVNIGNIKADMLATMAINKRKKVNNNVDVIVEYFKLEKDYWKEPSINMDIFYFKQLFNFYPTTIGKKIYYGLNYKKESDMGKKITDVTYTIIKVKEPNELIDNILNIIKDALGTTYYPFIVILDKLTNKSLLRDYLLYGKDFLTVKRKPYISIETASGIEIAKVLDPPGLSAIVIEKIRKLEKTVDNFIINNLSEIDEIFDITDLIYDVNDKKTTIKSDFINDKFKIKFKYENKNFRAVTIKLRPGLDLPSRNILKRYEKLNPKVYLIVTVTNYVLDYKTIITLNDNIIIYSNNIYSNKIIMKPKKI